jgi:uncharacterized protein (DUF58 family)
MIGILLISGTVSRAVLRRLVLHRALPETAVVGAPAIITYHVQNTKRFWPSFSVTVAEVDGVEAFTKQPHAYMLHAAPRMTAIIPAEVIPKRRGLHQLARYQISTSFPFGFIKRAVEHQEPESILVYPPLADVDPKLLQMMRSAESTGTTMRPRRGGMDEFYGLKEHRSGESPRFIYWRRSARTGTLVAKEMTNVSPPKIIILADTYLPRDGATPEARGDIERAIAMAASLASHALEAGLSIGLVAWSRDGWLKVQPNRGKRHRRDVLSLLAQLPDNSVHDAQELVAQSSDMQESATTAVMFTSRGSEMTTTRTAGGLMIVTAKGDQARRWFRFHPDVDFDHAMPMSEEE